MGDKSKGGKGKQGGGSKKGVNPSVPKNSQRPMTGKKVGQTPKGTGGTKAKGPNDDR